MILFFDAWSLSEDELSVALTVYTDERRAKRRRRCLTIHRKIRLFFSGHPFHVVGWR